MRGSSTIQERAPEESRRVKRPVDNLPKGRRRFCHPCHLLASGVDTSRWPKRHQSLGNWENPATFAILVEERPVFFVKLFGC
jgi:hypothetical protein